MVHFFSESLKQNFTPKMGHFGFFQIIKKYAETALLIDEKCISPNNVYHPYTAQQSPRKIETQKIGLRENISEWQSRNVISTI